MNTSIRMQRQLFFNSRLIRKILAILCFPPQRTKEDEVEVFLSHLMVHVPPVQHWSGHGRMTAAFAIKNNHVHQ